MIVIVDDVEILSAPPPIAKNDMMTKIAVYMFCLPGGRTKLRHGWNVCSQNGSQNFLSRTFG